MCQRSSRWLRRPSGYDIKQVCPTFNSQQWFFLHDHLIGLSDEEELHQYVLYDTQEQKKGPRRINLDDDPKDKYAPPKNLTVHLSKIPLPELQPKGHVKEKSTKDSKKKEDKMGWW